MVAFSDLASPSLAAPEAAQATYPQYGPNTPPSFVLVPTNVVIALLIEMRILNNQLAAEAGTNAIDLTQARADEAFNIGPQGTG